MAPNCVECNFIEMLVKAEILRQENATRVKDWVIKTSYDLRGKSRFSMRYNADGDMVFVCHHYEHTTGVWGEVWEEFVVSANPWDHFTWGPPYGG